MYFDHMAQYQYHTEATIEYMENYLEEFHHNKDVVSQFRATKSTRMVSDALKMQRTLDNRRIGRDTPRGPMFWRLQSIGALMKIKCRTS
jgi:hypothetical protein